jgi:EpsI family protein
MSPMSPLLRTGILIAALMFGATALAVVMRPTHKIADQGPKFDLATMIPRDFGNWHEEILSKALIVDPQQKELLDTIYSQLLSRTYKNDQGYRIMLSIAYGNDQSDSMQVHKPEICYPAQGFVLENKSAATLPFGKGTIPITRVATSLGQRKEPITYWTTIGDQTVKPGIHKKLVEMSYGLTGKIPDGMLVRVSSIDPDTANAYRMQDQFAQQMLEALAPDARKRLAGNQQEN